MSQRVRVHSVDARAHFRIQVAIAPSLACMRFGGSTTSSIFDGVFCVKEDLDSEGI
jgi:hypothetical protein